DAAVRSIDGDVANEDVGDVLNHENGRRVGVSTALEVEVDDPEALLVLALGVVERERVVVGARVDDGLVVGRGGPVARHVVPQDAGAGRGAAGVRHGGVAGVELKAPPRQRATVPPAGIVEYSAVTLSKDRRAVAGVFPSFVSSPGLQFESAPA